MGILIQRRPFDHADFAHATAAGFQGSGFAIPGITIATNVAEIDGQIYLVLIQEGAVITGPEPILPDYEMVSFTP